MMLSTVMPYSLKIFPLGALAPNLSMPIILPLAPTYFCHLIIHPASLLILAFIRLFLKKFPGNKWHNTDSFPLLPQLNGSLGCNLQFRTGTQHEVWLVPSWVVGVSEMMYQVGEEAFAWREQELMASSYWGLRLSNPQQPHCHTQDGASICWALFRSSFIRCSIGWCVRPFSPTTIESWVII